MKKTTLRKNAIHWKHHVRVRKRLADTRKIFFLRSLAAQIHLFGAVLSLVFLVVGLYFSSGYGVKAAVSVSVFALSAFTLFLSSGIMHLLSDGYRVSQRFELFLENLDKCSIYFLISGTYTAVVSRILSFPKDVFIISTVWIITAFGIVYTFGQHKLPKLLAHRYVSTGQFLVMGWLVVFFIGDVFREASALQFTLILLGGLLYTIGAVVYMLEKPNLSRYFGYHEIWHLLVVLACISFFGTVLLFYV